MFEALRVIGRCHFVERPARTTLTVLGIALGVSVSVAIRTANVDVLRSFQDTVNTVAGRATLEVSGGELGLDENMIAVLRSHPDVSSASPILHQSARVVGGPNDGKSLIVMGLDLLEAREVKGLRVRGAGRDDALLVEGLLAADTIFVGKRLAAEWGVQVGTALDILVGMSAHRVVIRGLLESESGLPSAWEHMGVMLGFGGPTGPD